MFDGRVLTPFAPMCRPKIGTARASIAPAERAKESPGRRSTASTIRRQKRLSAASVRPRLRPTTGTRSELTRSPTTLGRAGRSVNAAATETIPTRIAPRARLRMIEVGTMNMPSSAITNVEPLNRTARLGGGARMRDRVLLGQSQHPLFAVARHDEQRVVDPQREAHPGEHVHDEDRE